MVAEARDEPGALPLVQNALHWLWQQRTDDRLSGRLLNDQGGLAGILSQGADHLLLALGRQRDRALELLFRLVKVDPEGRRHTRQRMPLADAVAVAGGGAVGRALVDHLAGTRARDDPKAVGPLRLITVADEAEELTTGQRRKGWVNLIHETLIRSKGLDAKGQPQPYWPTLWRYIEQHQDRAARRERLQLLAREWKGRKGLARLFGLAGWLELVGFRGLAAPGSIEQRYLRWSTVRGLVLAGVLAMLVGVVGESLHWKTVNELPLEAVWTRWTYKLGMVELPFPKPIPIHNKTFKMGDERNSEEQHRVTFAQPFFLGETEVTFAQYDAFARATGHALPNDSGFGRDDRPVINVGWSDARAYARWLGAMTGRTCRLPSEAEWEYACRAGTTKAYAVPKDTGGSDDIKAKGLANCADCGSEWDGRETAPVGRFPANAWGLHDMHGNVWEWVEDCWHDRHAQASCGWSSLARREWRRLQYPGAARRVLGRRSGPRAVRRPLLVRPGRPARQLRFSGGVFVPHCWSLIAEGRRVSGAHGAQRRPQFFFRIPARLASRPRPRPTCCASRPRLSGHRVHFHRGSAVTARPLYRRVRILTASPRPRRESADGRVRRMARSLTLRATP